MSIVKSKVNKSKCNIGDNIYIMSIKSDGTIQGQNMNKKHGGINFVLLNKGEYISL